MTGTSRRVLLIMVAMVALTTLPYLAGVLSAPGGTRFSGVIINPLDYNSHLAKMQQGARGVWLYQLLFTAEPHTPALLQTFYVALGHLVPAGASDLAFDVLFQLARMVCTALMVWALWLFLRHYLGEREGWWALLLCLFSGGIGYLLLVVAPAMTKQISPIEFWLIDAYTFFAAFSSPHLAAGIALLAIAFLAIDQWTRGQFAHRLLILFVVSLAIALIQPFDLFLLDSVLILVGLWRMLRKQIAPLKLITGLLLIGAAHGAIAGYDWIVLYHFPIWQSFTTQNITLSPPLIYYVLGYAPTLFPALGGIVLIVRRRDERWLVPMLWLIVVAALIYAPLATQRRFVLGVQAPLSALALYWLANTAIPWLRKRFRRRYGTFLLVYGAIAVLSTVAWLTFLIASTRSSANRDLYIPNSVQAAWQWIDLQTPVDSVVLAGFTDGGNLVGRTGRRTVLGHWIETADYLQKKDAVNRFFAADTDDQWRPDFLTAQHVSYVWYGAEEQKLGSWTPASSAYLHAVFTTADVILYQVQPITVLASEHRSSSTNPCPVFTLTGVQF